MKNELLRQAVAEFLGTFTLVFVGVAASASGQGVAVAGLAHGLILVGIVFAYGELSGAHVNPAVTAGLLVGKQISAKRAAVYMIAQFAGALVAAVAVNTYVPGAAALGETIGSLTESAVWQAAAFEAVMTFFLVSAVYRAAVFGKLGHLAALAIGLTLAGSIMAGGTYTGASLNPARTLGPALVGGGNLNYVIPYFIGIFIGGIAAGLLHAYVLNPDDSTEAS